MLSILLILALCGGPSIRSTGPGKSFTSPSSASFVLAQSLDFGGPNVPGTLPACTAATGCNWVCLATGTPDEQCFDNQGNQLTGMVQGTTAFGGFFGTGNVLLDAKDNGPVITNAFFNPFWSQPNLEIQAFWYPTTATSTVGFVYEGTGNNNAVEMRYDNGNLDCIFVETGNFPTPTTPMNPGGWVVTDCRRCGSDHFARVHNTDGTDVVQSNSMTADTSGSHASIGFAVDQLGFPSRGPIRAIYGYTTCDTARRLANENAFWGLPSSGPATTNTSVSQLTGLMPLDGGQNADLFAAGAAIVDVKHGLHTQKGYTNSWSSPLDVSTSTAINAATVATNVASGIFSRAINGAAEVDRVVDADAVNLAGRESPNSTTIQAATIDYKTGCFVVAAGDTGTVKTKARIEFSQDGTGPTYSCDPTMPACGNCVVSGTGCNYSGLTSTYCPIGCRVLSTNATTVKPRILVGNVGTDTGSLLVNWSGGFHNQYCEMNDTTGSAHGNGYFDISATAYPHGSAKGAIEIVFTPLWNIDSTGWPDQEQGSMYVFDLSDTVPAHVGIFIPGYNTVGQILGSIRNGASADDLIPTGKTLTPMQQYVARLQWQPHGTGCDASLMLDTCSDATTCHASTVLASDVTGTQTCPGTPVTHRLGNRFDNTVPTSVWIRKVLVFR